MNILVFSHMYPNDFDRYSGIFVKQQIEALKDEGNKVFLINPISYVPFFLLGVKKYSVLKKTNKIEYVDGIKIFHPKVLVFPKGFLYEFYGIIFYIVTKKLIKNIIKNEKIDVVHIHTAYPDGYAVCKAVKNMKVKSVITIHGQDMAYNITNNKYLKNNTIKAMKKADKIVCVSNKLRDKAITFIEKNKIEMVNNGINESDVQEPGFSFLKDDKNIKILSVGNLIELKGFDYLIESMNILIKKKNIKNIVLYIAGKGEEELHLKKMVESKNIEDNIKFIGALEHNEIMKCMADCDIFALPSWNEGFGMVYLEAMASGKPVIACKGQGIEDVIVNNESGFLVETKNAIDLADVLELLINSRELRIKMGNFAKDIVSNNYTWKANVKRIQEIYKSLYLGEDKDENLHFN